MRSRPLHPLLRDRPDGVGKIDLVPDPVLELALADHAQQDELQAETDRRQGRHLPQQVQSDPDLRRRQRPVTRPEGGDGGRSDPVCRIVDLLAVQDGVGVDLFDDVPDVDGRRRRAPFDDHLAVGAKVVGRDLVQQPVAPLRQDFPVEDGPPHVAGAVRHGRMIHPALGHILEAAGLLQAPFGPLLLQSGRDAFGDHPLGVDDLLAGLCERQAGGAVGAQRHGFPPPVEPVIVLEGDAALGRDQQVQTVPVGQMRTTLPSIPLVMTVFFQVSC